MPRVKGKQRLFGVEWLLLPELEKFMAKSKNSERHLFLEEATVLIRVATDPEILTATFTAAKTIRDFCELYAREPDLVIDVLQFIRMQKVGWSKNQAQFVTSFLRTASPDTQIKIDSYRPETIASASDDQIAQYMTDTFQRLGFKITTVSVTKARQSIAKADVELSFQHSPEVSSYMQSGIVSPKLKALIASRKTKKT